MNKGVESMDLHALSGMRDYIGSSREELGNLVETARDVMRGAGFREIETPVLEDARLFNQSLGSESDIVSQEMYTVEQSGDRIVALRPENTAGVVRAVLENKLLSRHNQLKLFYEGPMFRHERPQSGRLRQFHQVGVEVIGREDSLIDAELMKLGARFLEEVEIKSPTLLLNSLGCPRCRPGYLEKFTETLKTYREELCEDCSRRLEVNPLRMLDCKNESCQSLYQKHAPLLLEFLCEDCEAHFETVKEYLDGFMVDYEIDPYLVRGLDYYCRTAFEFVVEDLGSQDAVLAGGRYDGLMKELGGDPFPAIGFAAGLERIMLLRGSYENRDVETRCDCYVISFDQTSLRKVLPLVTELRSRNHPLHKRRLSVELGKPANSVKSQFRRADRYGAKIVILHGTDEREKGIVNVKKMASGEQVPVNYDSVESTADGIIRQVQTLNLNEQRNNHRGRTE